ncbi:hypothetical protein T08_2875 [Trichinella sp. T8]|nr:hypothetical protein T08_2875 [Trichinella sp. T8]
MVSVFCVTMTQENASCKWQLFIRKKSDITAHLLGDDKFTTSIPIQLPLLNRPSNAQSIKSLFLFCNTDFCWSKFSILRQHLITL